MSESGLPPDPKSARCEPKPIKCQPKPTKCPPKGKPGKHQPDLTPIKLPLGPPQPVSPLIRGARYILLISGVVYGMVKLANNKRREENWRNEEAKKQIIRDQHAAIRRERIAAEERQAVVDLENGKLFERI